MKGTHNYEKRGEGSPSLNTTIREERTQEENADYYLSKLARGELKQ